MNITRQDPWSLTPRLQDEINRLFGNVQQTDSSSSATATWVPAVDIDEYGDRFELYVDVPGGSKLRRTDARGRHPDGSQASEQRKARPIGRMSRSISAPSAARASLIEFCVAGHWGSDKVNATRKDRAC